MPIRSSPLPAPSPSPLASPAFRRLVYVQACFGLAFATFMILPKYLALRGVGAGRLSLIMGTASLINVVSAPLVTWLGRQVSIRSGLMIGNAVMAVGALGFGIIDPASPGPLPFLLRLVQGLAWAVVFATASLLAMNLAPRGRLGQAIALQSSANLAAGALAPALAEPALAAFGARPVFLVAALVALVGASLAAGIEGGNTPPGPAGATSSGRPPGPLLVTSVVLGIACGAMLVLHQPLALARGIGRVSDFLVAYTAGALIVRLALGRVTDRIGAARVSFASFLLYGAVVAAMPGLAPTALVPSLVVFGGLFGVAHGLFWPAFLTLSLGWGGEGGAGRHRMLAWINAAFNAGVASVGGLGLLAEHAGFALVFIPVGVLTAACALLLGRWTRHQTT